MTDIWVEKMLTISTAHLRASTCNEWLHEPEKGITAYEKGEYGWFVHAGSHDSLHAERARAASSLAMPNELRVVLDFAREHGCEWVCFDRDGDEVVGLVTYEW